MSSSSNKVVTRFAPSPTGFLHVGGLRTALYNYLFAKQNDGEMLLRIEDTDRERLVPGAIEKLISTLETMGITYSGNPVIQSERREIYHEHVLKLVENGDAYYCFCTKERLEKARSEQEAKKEPTKYDRCCRNLTSDEVTRRLAGGEPAVIRILIPDGETTFIDIIRGEITIPNSEVDDQVLWKTDGYPTYHLANVIDDHIMGVTHVIRGEEWISSVPKHIILYKAFGWNIPKMTHVPLILNPDRTKLSKRQGDVAVEDYLEKGYTVEALINFIAMIGWNPGTEQEVFSMDDLIKVFDINRVHKAGGIFNVEKLDWLNREWIKKYSYDQQADAMRPFLKDTNNFDEARFQKLVPLLIERITTWEDIAKLRADGEIDYFFSDPVYDLSLLMWKTQTRDYANANLRHVYELLQTYIGDWTNKNLHSLIWPYAEEKGRGDVLWPLRVSLSGKEKSPDPFTLLDFFGKDESLRRIALALEK